MARTPVNMDLGSPELAQTFARPSGISAPVATVQASPALALAESLRGIRPELNSYLAEIQQSYQQDEANRAYDKIQGMTFDEAKQAVESGEMRQTESPWYQAAFQKQFGLSYAANRKREILTAYNTQFDKENGNVDEFLAQFARDDFQQFEGSEFIRAGIREGMNGLFENVKNTQAEYTSTQLQNRATEQAYTLMGSAVDESLASGADVGSVLGSIYSDSQASLGITPDAMDANALALAEKYANEGNLEAVNAILEADPQGRGSFLSRPAYATKAQTLREAAGAMQGKNNRTANTMTVIELRERANQGLLDDGDVLQINTFRDDQQLSQAEAESLLMQNSQGQQERLASTFEMNTKSAAITTATKLVTSGQAAIIQDTSVFNPHTGKNIEIKAEELVDGVVTEQLNAIAEAGKDKPNITAVMGQQLASYAVSTTYKPWEKALSDGYVALTNTLRTADAGGNPTIPAPAQAGYKTWKELAGSPAIRERHITDPVAAQIYRDAETLESNGYMGPEDALIAAARAAEMRKDGRVSLSTNIDRDKFASTVRKYTQGGWFTGAASNAGFAEMEIERQARILIDMNVPMDRAVEEAATRFESSYTNINGVYVNTRDRLVPPNFGQIVEAHLEDFVATHPDAEDEDLTLWPSTDQDYWYITDQNGIRIDGSMPFHISALQKNPRAYSMADANREVIDNR